MTKRFRTLILIGASVLLFGAMIASSRGWGVSRLHDQQLIAQLNKDCPASERDRYGNCPQRYRPRLPLYLFLMRSGTFRGGGRSGSYRGGK